MDVRVVIMNHEDLDFDDRVAQIRKGGYGKKPLKLRKITFINLVKD